MADTNIGAKALGDLVLGASSAPSLDQHVQHTITFTQSISSTFNVVESNLVFTQDVTYQIAYGRSVTSTYSPTQEIKILKDEDVGSTLTFSQDIDYEKAKVQSVPDTLTLTQTIDRSYIGGRLIVHGLNWTHTRHVNAVFAREIISSYNPTQLIVAHHCRTASNILNLSQSISFNKLKHIHHQLDLGSIATYTAIFNRTMLQIYPVFQTIERTVVYNKSVENTLNFTQSIVQARVLGIEHHLNLTQTIDAVRANNVKNIIAYTQSISYNITHNVEMIQNLALTSTITMSRSKTLKVHHGFGVNSIVDQQKIMTFNINHTYNPMQEIVREVHREEVSQNLVFTQSVGYQPIYPNSIVSPLSFSQSIGLQTIFSRSVENQLLFLPYKTIYVGMGEATHINIDSIQYALIPGKKKSMCVLQVPNAVITLPSPEWGDGEAYDGLFTIRRSMNNVPYTYVRNLSLRKLKCPWLLSKRKAWELREFLIQHNAEIMTFTTWKGDKWFVNLVTNPFELTVSGRYELENERVNVELEFEGLKVM